MSLIKNTTIRIRGLSNAKQYNGCAGVVISERGEDGRIAVRIVTKRGTRKKLKVRERNVIVVDANDHHDKRIQDEDARLLKRITEFVERADPRGLVLDGAFKAMLDPAAFRKALFPLTKKEEFQEKSLPRSLSELLRAPHFRSMLMKSMPRVREKAQSIAEGTRRRAQREGQLEPMPASQVWEITLESFARDLVGAVKNFIATQTVSRCSALASPDHECAGCDQLNQVDVSRLSGDEHVVVVDDFFGKEWTNLIKSDVDRFCTYESGDFVESNAVAGLMSRSTQKCAEERALDPYPQLASIRHDCGKAYPALAQAADALQALPYELNAKAFPEKLSVAAEGQMMILRFRGRGCRSRVRLDSESKGTDNGIRVSCIYFPSSLGPGASGCELLLRRHLSSNEDDSKDEGSKVKIPPKADRLVLYRSDLLYQETTPLLSSSANGNEPPSLPCVVFYIRKVF